MNDCNYDVGCTITSFPVLYLDNMKLLPFISQRTLPSVSVEQYNCRPVQLHQNAVGLGEV